MSVVTAAPTVLRLDTRPPFDGAGVLRWLAARAVPGIEEIRDGAYRRTLRLPGGPGVVAVVPRRRPRAGDPAPSAADLDAAVAACRRLLDLDADPRAHRDVLAADLALAPLVAATPGMRAPGTVDPAESAVRAVLGQQVSLAAARTLAPAPRRGVRPALGEPDGPLTHVFPAPDGDRRRARPRGDRDARRAAAHAPRALLGPGGRRPVLDGRADPPPSARTCSRSPGSGRGRRTTSPCARSATATRSPPATSACAARRAPSASPTTRPASRRTPSAGGPGGGTRRTTSGRRAREVARVATPIGELTLVATDAGLREVRFAGEAPPAPRPRRVDDPVLAAAADKLRAWFAGERTAFDLPLDLAAATDFQRRAWLALSEIPYATTRSYGEQARVLGAPRAARAVGAANGRNPLPIVLPCHRLVGADGSLTGFGGGLDVKRALLDHEAGTAARAAAAGSARTRTSRAPRRRT